MMTGLPSVGLPSVGERSRLRTRVGGGRARARRGYREQIQLGRAGRCPDRPAHLILTIDSSGSVTGGNDPIGQRFVEAAAAIARVGRACRCGEELVSILHFDHPVTNDVIEAGLTDQAEIEQALQNPLDGRGCSLLGASLATAREVAARHPDHRNALVALTDFELFDPVSVWDNFVTFPGEVHACVLGARFRGFDDDPRVTVTHIDRAQPPGALAKAIFAAATAERPAVVPRWRTGRSASGTT